MVVTCGLDRTLAPGADTAEHFNQPHIMKTVQYRLHGRIGGLPARLIGYGEQWDGDECLLWAEREVVQAAIFGEHLVLRRRIEAKVGGSTSQFMTGSRTPGTHVRHVCFSTIAT
jgi:hypothetical protein